MTTAALGIGIEPPVRKQDVTWFGKSGHGWLNLLENSFLKGGQLIQVAVRQRILSRRNFSETFPRAAKFEVKVAGAKWLVQFSSSTPLSTSHLLISNIIATIGGLSELKLVLKKYQTVCLEWKKDLAVSWFMLRWCGERRKLMLDYVGKSRALPTWEGSESGKVESLQLDLVSKNAFRQNGEKCHDQNSCWDANSGNLGDLWM